MARIPDISEVICGVGDNRCAPIAFFKNMNHKWYSSNFNAVDVKLHHKMATIGFMKNKEMRQTAMLLVANDMTESIF